MAAQPIEQPQGFGGGANVTDLRDCYICCMHRTMLSAGDYGRQQTQIAGLFGAAGGQQGSFLALLKPRPMYFGGASLLLQVALKFVLWRDDGDDLDVLLRRVQRGDAKAWSKLVERFQNIVYSSARRVGLSREDSEDVFVAVFQAFLSSKDRLESGRALPKWFAVTSARISLRQARASRTTVNLDEPELLDDLVAAEEDHADEIAQRSLLSNQVWDGVLALAEKCRRLLTLIYSEEETTYELISADLGMPIGAIGPTKARCLEKLRRALASSGLFDLNDCI